MARDERASYDEARREEGSCVTTRRDRTDEAPDTAPNGPAPPKGDRDRHAPRQATASPDDARHGKKPEPLAEAQPGTLDPLRLVLGEDDGDHPPFRPFHIGFRTVKTVIAVFICFVIDLFRSLGNPFHSAIAAIICMQRNVEDSWVAGRQRFLATLIGGLYGMLFLVFETYVIPVRPLILRYAVLTLLLIPVIQTSVALRQYRGTALTCIVFFAVTISNMGGDPFSYGLNRIVDTLIGIVISLLVNRAFKAPDRRARNGLDA